MPKSARESSIIADIHCTEAAVVAAAAAAAAASLVPFRSGQHGHWNWSVSGHSLLAS